MRRTLHAIQVVGLLAGFYVLCVGIVAALVVLDVLVTMQIASHTALARELVLLYLLTAAALYIVGRGVFVSTRLRHRDVVGVAVSDQNEPALWHRVRFLADSVGTRAPKRIYLVPDVNAAVWENSQMLGLIPGARNMMIGVPLLIGLTPAQFDAVIAHELGHYGNRDTRLGAIDRRARSSVMAAVAAAAQLPRGRRREDGQRRRIRIPGQAAFFAIFRAYAKLVLSVTQEASRRQEYAADRVAADIAGHANAAAALRELPAIAAAYSFYLERYVARGIERDLLPPPPEVLGGFAALLADPERQAELDGIRREPAAEESDKFDSHPPTADRVAAILALPPDGRPLDRSASRAIAVLVNPPAAMAGVGLRMLRETAAGKRAVDWDTLATAAATDRVAEQAKPLREAVASLYGRPVPLVAFLDAVDAGRLDEILTKLPKSDAAQRATGRVAREFAMTTMLPMLHGWALAELAAQRRIRWRNSWSNIAGEVQMPPDLARGLDAAMDAMAAMQPDTRPMRAALYAMGAPV